MNDVLSSPTERMFVATGVVPGELDVDRPDHEIDGFVPDDFEPADDMDGLDLPYLSEKTGAKGERCAMKARKRRAAREMKEGPSKPPCRRRLQTAIRCCGQSERCGQ
jgi:hypothetical protein